MLHAELVQRSLRKFGLCLGQRQRLHYQQLAFASPLGQGQTQRAAPGLAWDLVGVIARLRPKDLPAVTPQRRTRGARTGPAGTLLPPGLASAARAQAAGLGRGRSGTPIRKLHAHRIVQQSLSPSRPNTAPANS